MERENLCICGERRSCACIVAQQAADFYEGSGVWVGWLLINAFTSVVAFVLGALVF